MYLAHTKVLDSSSVTASCSGSLLRPGCTNLIVAKHDVLEVYTVEDEGAHNMQLEGSYSMTAGIQGMDICRFPGHDVDALVLVFPDAKLSVLMWDAATHGFTVKALHLLEDAALLAAMDDPKPHVMLRIDKGGADRAPQCLVVLMRRRYLFILPFAKMVGSGEWGGSTAALQPPAFPLNRPGLIDLQESDITGVRDIAFVKGYYKPTLMVLHEVTQNWSGRLELALGDEGRVVEKKYLTFGASTVSLTIAEGRIDHTTLTITSRLPYNSFRLVALPAEPYGVLVVAANTLCHVAQTEQTSFAVHVNNYGQSELRSDTALQMPFDECFVKRANNQRVQLHLNPNKPESARMRLVLDLANCHVAPMRDGTRFFLSLASGETAFIHLARNKQNGTVSTISIRIPEGLSPLSCMPKQPGTFPSCPLPSTLCVFGNFLFIGSASGDSLLLRQEYKASNDGKFVKVLTLLNTGPITDVALGDSAVDKEDTLDEDLDDTFPTPSLGMSSVVPVRLKPTTERSFTQRHENMEAVVTCGRDKDGAVCILNRTIKPLLLCSNEMQVDGVWSFRFPPPPRKKRKRKEEAGEEEEPEVPPEAPPGAHDYLAVASGEKTQFLRCGKAEIEEDFCVPFSTEPSVCVSNALDGACVVQVTRRRIIARDRKGGLAEVAVGDDADAASAVHQAWVIRNQAVVLLANGSLQIATVFFVADFTTGGDASPTLSIDLRKPPVHFPSRALGYVTALGVADAMRGDPFFTPGWRFADQKQAFDGKKPGDGEKQQKSVDNTLTALTVAYSCGKAEIVDVSTDDGWTVIASFDGILNAPDLLVPEGSAVPSPVDHTTHIPERSVAGVYTGRIEAADKCPHLFLLFNDEKLAVYKGFLHGNGLRFAKAHAGFHVSSGRPAVSAANPAAPPKLAPYDPALQLNPDFFTKASADLAGAGEEVGAGALLFVESPVQPSFVPFANIFSNEGVFCRNRRLGGSFAFSERSLVRVHSLTRTLGVSCMAPLNTTGSCSNGFVLGCRAGLKIMHLTWHKRLNLRCPWPTRKILLRSTPHKIVFDPTHRTYTLVVSTPHPFKPVKTAFDSEADPFLNEKDSENRMTEVSPLEGVPVPTNERYELLLYSSFSWKPFAGVTLKENEQVLCCENVTLSRPDPIAILRSSGVGVDIAAKTRAAEIHIQACGTGFPISEDIPCRGRLLLLRVRVGRTRDDRILEIDHEVATKGPVSAICSADGRVFAAVAGKVHVYNYDWNTKKLMLVAWCDAKFYTTSLTSFRNFILAGDMYHSVMLMRYTEQGHQLTVIGRDLNHLSVVSSNFVFDRSTLSICVFDDNGNASTYSFEPPTLATQQTHLRPQADMHIDTLVNDTLQIRTLRLPSAGEDWMPQPGARTALLFGTKEGALCTLQPVAEATHRDMHWLYGKMITETEHFAGLHPRASRKFCGHRVRVPDVKSRRSVILDMNLLGQFLELSSDEQQELTTAAGLGDLEHVEAAVKSIRQEAAYL